MFLLRRQTDVQRQGTSQVRRRMSGIRRLANDLRSTVPERAGTLMPGRLRRMEVAAAAICKFAGGVQVQGTQRGSAQAGRHLPVDCQSVVGTGLSGCQPLYIVTCSALH